MRRLHIGLTSPFQLTHECHARPQLDVPHIEAHRITDRPNLVAQRTLSRGSAEAGRIAAEHGALLA